MTRTPDHRAERPFSAPAGTPADVLSRVLATFRVQGAALLRGEYSAPWAWEAPPASAIGRLLHGGRGRLVTMHVIVEGRCWLEAPGALRLSLQAGDLVGFPQGDGHRMGNGRYVPPFAILPLYPRPPWRAIPSISRLGTGEVTRILCVYLRCETLIGNPFLDGLPPVLLLRPSAMGDEAPWLEATLRQLIREACADGPGGALVTARLTEALFVAILRDCVARGSAPGAAWLSALADRHLARALALLHAEPCRNWTLAALARETGLSRSSLGARFRDRLGIGPLGYLARWRMQLAAAALTQPGGTVAAAAAAANYASPEAFSRAFRRHTGLSPSHWRDRAPAPDVTAATPAEVAAAR